MKNLIAVNNLDPNVAGVITFWRLSGVTRHEALVAALKHAAPNIAPPPPPSPDKALRRAVVEVQEPRLLMRPLQQGLTKGWALVRERTDNTTGTETLRHHVETTIHLRPDGNGNLIDVQPSYSPHQPRLLEGFERYIDEVPHADVIAWLARTVLRLSAVGLRDTGGVYFVPRESVQSWVNVHNAMKAAALSHNIFTIPALRSEDAVAAISEALESEMAQSLSGLQAVLDEEDASARKLGTTADKCLTLLAKVEQYERLLETSQDSLSQRIKALQADIIAAKLAADVGEAA